MKDELRAKYKKLRKDFSGTQREQATKEIISRAIECIGQRKNVLLYNSFGTELDTHTLIKTLLDGGKNVLLPRVEGREIKAIKYGEMKSGAYGIGEPVGEEYTGEIDVVIVPFLAVNSRGYRLGYGGGYYDRFLKGKNFLKMGLGYYFQLCDDFNEDDWDEPLDMLVCERGIYKFN